MQASGLVRTQFGCSRRTTNFGSRLNPLTRPSAVLQTNATISESIQIHFSNLQKLIQKKTESIPAVETTSSITTTGSGRTVEFLEQFNLGKILWETKPEDQMSPPVNLNHLKRLLSNSSPQYSPRNNIGKRWREYHGIHHWTGLLDPLDENLRREVVRYGEFVQAAYHAFNYHPATTTYESDITLPDKSYKVTKNLYATSSITMPKWIDDVAPDLGWMTQRSSWIGYVAVCDDEREIVRMGRRDIVIVLRGTSTCLEWAENFRDFLVELPGPSPSATAKPPNKVKVKVECGFKSLYTTPGAEPNSPSLSESIVNEVERLIQLYKGENLSISITGHSLGAALALLAADELSSISTTSDPPIAVFSFGGPRVGNKGFANRIVNNGVKVLRVVNSQDVITRVPGILFNETLDQKLRENRSLQQILHDNMPWAYSHVGSELRLDTKMSPYLKPNADVACCHDLEAYLHLVDGFLASNCPFRANAKRSLVTLLSQQGSNVKKLYKNNVQAKTLNPKEGCISEVTSSVTG